MKKSVVAVGVAVATLSLGVGLMGCSSNKSSTKSSTSSSTSTSASTSTQTSPATTSAQASGPNKTIADYIKENNIQEQIIRHGDPGAPTIDLPVPENWTQVPESDQAPYGGITYNNATNQQDAPKIVAIVEKLTGNVDAQKLLSFAPGELKNLPGYSGGDGESSTLSNFPAYQLGGDYKKDGQTRVIAQKTVVIQGANGTYVLQLNAEGPESDASALMDATNVIDDKTTITP